MHRHQGDKGPCGKPGTPSLKGVVGAHGDKGLSGPPGPDGKEVSVPQIALKYACTGTCMQTHNSGCSCSNRSAIIIY